MGGIMKAPACLPSWMENPYRLVSLRELMIQCSGVHMFGMGVSVERLKCDCFFSTGLGKIPLPGNFFKGPLDSELTNRAVEWIKSVEGVCSRLGLAVSVELSREIPEKMASGRIESYQSLQTALEHLREIIEKELRTKTFFHVTPERMRFWPTDDDPYPFGITVAVAFPSALFDSREAGICIALARSTAGVFHLMRVLELGLSSLGSIFGVSLAHTNWAPAIEKIESEIRDMHKVAQWKTMPDCKEQQEFYAQAASHFGVLKDAWRNYTAHARGKFTEEEAALVFDNVKAFMQKLATRLHE
jgi:hypothetical protein